MKNLRDTLVVMVGRRVAIVASVGALACLHCSSFSGSETTPPPSTADAGVTDGGGGGGSDGETPPGPDGDAGGCQSQCGTAGCTKATFDAGAHAEGWSLSPNDDSGSYEDDALVMRSGSGAQAVFLQRTLTPVTSKYRLEFDYELDENAIVELVRFTTATNTFFVRMMDGGIVIGATNKGAATQPFGGRVNPGHISVTVDPSHFEVMSDCDPGTAHHVDVSSTDPPFTNVSLGLHPGVSKDIELRIDNLVFEAL